MKSKHTPGPWGIYDGNQFGICTGEQLFAISDETATCCLASVDNGDDTDLANARLIAAAPEMLEALERCIAALTLKSTKAYKQEAAAIARSVIAKVERSA